MKLSDVEEFRRSVNFSRYHGQREGFYESFYQRANHPTEPLAFWIRYTVFSPRDRPQEAIGELWAVYFDGLSGHKTALKEEWPLSACVFDNSAFFARIGAATLETGRLKGGVASNRESVVWDLTFVCSEEPSPFMPLPYYKRSFPAAKSAIGCPMARYRGTLNVNGQTVRIEDWVGSQNHNWGRKHTDEYAQGQVPGFDNAPESFFEVVNARLKVGPIRMPPITPAVLRHRGEEHTFYGLSQALKARGTYRYFELRFRLENRELAIDGVVSAPKDSFVAFVYYNPPGGIKHCLNTKIAACRLKLRYKKRPGTEEELSSRHRSLFEIVTSDLDGHGLEAVGT